VVGGAVAYAGAGTPSYWGDEAASIVSAQRSLPSLFAELGHIDAVHGLYYLFLHFWTGAFGTSEAVVRFPSAVAAGFAIAGTVALGRRLLGTTGGIIAGAVIAVLPEFTRIAIEARSYAFSMAVAVWLTWLLIVLVRRAESRKRFWLIYAAGLAFGTYLFLYLAMLVVVHLVVLIVERPSAPVVRRWLQAVAVAGVLALPIGALAIHEQHQIAFLAKRNYATVSAVLVKQWFSKPIVAVIAWALIVAGVAITLLVGRRRLPGLRGGQAIALAWVVIPTAILLAGNAWIAPMYNMRYAAFCLPGVAIAIAAGIVQLSRFARGLRARTLVAIWLAVILAGAAAPTFIAQRGEFAKDGGSDLRQIAETVKSVAKPGDAIVFDQAIKPSRRPRMALDVYPSDFEAVADIALVTPYDDRPGIWDTVAPTDTLAPQLTGFRTVWAVEARGSSSADLETLRFFGYIVSRSIHLHRTVLYELTKETR